jgi:hypothetical protein
MKSSTLINVGFVLEWMLFVLSGVALERGSYVSFFIWFMLAIGMALGVGKEIKKEAIRKYKEKVK